MSLPIQISPQAYDVMRQHAEEHFPDECCGFLYGHDNDVSRNIMQAVPVLNVKVGDKRRRFEISPQDYMKAERYALLQQTTLLGVYHSHPQHPAIASEHDLKQAMPYFSYVILSVMDGKTADIKSWQLNEANTAFAEETITAKFKI